jgi:hypothetical protein
MNIAPWLRSMVRQMTIDDVPASWQAERWGERSHDSCTDGRCFMMRLDKTSSPSRT